MGEGGRGRRASYRRWYLNSGTTSYRKNGNQQGKAFQIPAFFVLLDNLPPHLPGVPSPTSQVKTLECPQLPLIRLTFQLGRLSSYTITHAIFPPDNRFFCVLLTQTYKAPLCCFQKSLCCRNNSQTCQTHIGSPPPLPCPLT